MERPQGERDRVGRRVQLHSTVGSCGVGILGGLNLGPGKPEHIFAQTGRLPVFAGGNADVDIEMLSCATFALLINHDDEEREFAYTTSAEASQTQAAELGWTVVSMKNDWTTVF